MPNDDAPPPETRPDLPDLATRVAASQEAARQRRVQLGLPPDADDGGYTPAKRKPRKHAPKRHKRHGQFLGTVCDEWPKT